MRGAFDKLAEIRPTLARGQQPVSHEDEFLQADDLVPVCRQTSENRQRMVLAELTEIFRDRRWQQSLDLFYPVEEKLPELVDLELDVQVREKLAFALGKIEYQANRLPEARDALLFAERCRNREPIDFVFELLARVYLGLESPDKALEAVQRVPEKYRRPYFRWTEADVLCALKQYDQAKAVLCACIENDRRSRHKGLIRLCKIEYLLGEYKNAMTHARDADRFFREKWINAFDDGLFWMALGAVRCGKHAMALDAAEELRRYRPGYPKLNRLFALLQNQGGDDDPTS